MNRAIEEIKMVEEGNRTESDHIPLEVDIAGPKTSKKSGRKTVVEIERSDWTEEGARSYQENCSGWSCTQTETEDIWKEIREKLKGSIIKQRKKIMPWKLGRREWYDREWKMKKRELRKAMRFKEEKDQ